MKRKDCVAMILAGGQGSRLGSLTKAIAKPVVPFGGKYKIIDFALSNCINSGIDTVGVLTQYQPHELSRYIGSGQPWDMDRYNGGIYILPPYMKGKSGEWYKGTANAIYQNIAFVESFDPEDVLILSGDHIYIMDYRPMIEAHEAKRADATIAVITVPWEEASRFGIMAVDEDELVTSFAEKPKKPASNLASMGVYVFNWKMLKKYLILDEQSEKSSNDFGKNIIPMMLKDGLRLYAHSFHSYWKDVGTIESLWQANMDLLQKPLPLDMYIDSRRIYCRNPVKPPHFVSSSARISNCLVTEGCEIYGEVEKSVVFTGVTIGKGSRISNSVIFPNAKIGEGCVIDRAIVGDNAVIGDGCEISASARAGLDEAAPGAAAPGAAAATATAGAAAATAAAVAVAPAGVAAATVTAGTAAAAGAATVAVAPKGAAPAPAPKAAAQAAGVAAGSPAAQAAGSSAAGSPAAPEAGGPPPRLIGFDSLSGADIYDTTFLSDYCEDGISLIAPDVAIGCGVRIGGGCMVDRSIVAPGGALGAVATGAAARTAPPPPPLPPPPASAPVMAGAGAGAGASAKAAPAAGRRLKEVAP